jgi:hypothetical protein
MAVFNDTSAPVLSLGGLALEMSIFEMVPKLFLSDQTYSNRSEYDFLQVWSNIIDHNMSIKGVKVDIFSQVRFVVGFYSGSEWGWTYIPLVPQ